MDTLLHCLFLAPAAILLATQQKAVCHSKLIIGLFILFVMFHLSSIYLLNQHTLNLFAAHGISTTEDLINRAGDEEERRKLANTLGVTTRFMNNLFVIADLARVQGVGSEYAHLLKISGIESVQTLSMQTPADILHRMTTVNRSHKVVKRIPSISTLQGWVQQAATLV